MNPEPEHTFPIFEVPSSGLHRYLFVYSCQCADDGIPPEASLEHLHSCVESLRYYRDVPAREVDAAVGDAYNRVLNGYEKEADRLPRYSADTAKSIASENPVSLEDLAALSPSPPPDTPLEALGQLFRQDEMICVARRPDATSIATLQRYAAFDPKFNGIQFIVPNPMIAKRGLTKSGKLSKRCADNTGKRRRLVLDFDKPSAEIQPSLVAYLGDYCGQDPELVLHSGGKSVHSWFRCDEWSPDDIRTFEEEAALVGADPALLGEGRKCQLVRLPAGIRDNKKRQPVHFWNPNPCFK